MGWVTTSAEAQPHGETEWSCSACTLLNPSNLINCSVCHTPKESQNSSTATQSSENDSVICLSDSPNRAINKTYLNSALDKIPVVIQGKGVKRVAEDSGFQPSKKSIMRTDTGSPKLTTIHSRTLKQSSEFNKDMRTTNSRTASDGHVAKVGNLKEHSMVQSQSNKTNPAVPTTRLKHSAPVSQQSSDSEASKIPPCPTHKKRCNMKEVHKEGNNKGRWFFSCPLRSCNFFEVSL